MHARRHRHFPLVPREGARGLSRARALSHRPCRPRRPRRPRRPLHLAEEMARLAAWLVHMDLFPRCMSAI